VSSAKEKYCDFQPEGRNPLGNHKAQMFFRSNAHNKAQIYCKSSEGWAIFLEYLLGKDGNA